MANYRIFLASSTPAKPLARALLERLTEQEYEVVPWFEGTFQAGVSTLDALRQQARRCDFAVVLLTGDDVLLRADDLDQDRRVPRDNCVFEAGLFIGALNLDPRRCFLVSSVATEHLPSDLAGITHVAFKQKPGKISVSDARVAMASPASDIQVGIEAWEKDAENPDKVEIIARRELLDREKIGHPLGLLAGEIVIVSSDRPLDRESDFADRVHRNISELCRYLYYFPANEANATIVAQVIQSLATVGSQAESYRQRRRITEERPELVRENIGPLRERLRMYFRRTDPWYSLCVHNGNNLDRSRCYLRVADREGHKFVAGTGQDPARSVIDGLRKLRVDDHRGDHVLHSTSEYDLFSAENQGFRDALSRELNSLFSSELHEEIDMLCFGDPSVSQAA